MYFLTNCSIWMSRRLNFVGHGFSMVGLSDQQSGPPNSGPLPLVSASLGLKMMQFCFFVLLFLLTVVLADHLYLAG